MKDLLKLICFGISKGPGAEIVLPETGERDVLLSSYVQGTIEIAYFSPFLSIFF